METALRLWQLESTGQSTREERATQRGKLHRHTKKQKNISHEKKNQPVETDPKTTDDRLIVDKGKTNDKIKFHKIKKGEESNDMLRKES